MTFKERVDAFWNWFSENADYLISHVEAGQYELATDGELSSDAGKMVASVMDEWLPGFNYVFGVELHEGYSFTLSPNGNVDMRFLAEYWISQAPSIEQWKFYSSRQPGFDGDFSIELAQHEFESKSARFALAVDSETEVIDVTVWHPNFVADDDINSQVAFIFLDEALGETGTEMWIGKIELTSEKPSESVELKSLASEVVALASMHQWEKLTPDKTHVGYTVEEPKEGYPRSDTIAGATCHFQLVGEFMEREGLLNGDPVGSFGAEFLYLSIDASDFDEDEEVQRRADIEEQLNHLLVERDSGRVLGGATGFNNAYIDLLVFDGQNSIDLIEQSMQLQNLATKFSIQPFFERQSA